MTPITLTASAAFIAALIGVALLLGVIAAGTVVALSGGGLIAGWRFERRRDRRSETRQRR